MDFRTLIYLPKLAYHGEFQLSDSSEAYHPGPTLSYFVRLSNRVTLDAKLVVGLKWSSCLREYADVKFLITESNPVGGS